MVGLITGAAQGLGYELVWEGLKRGHRMAAGIRELASVPERLIRLKEQYQDQLILLQLDVTKEEEAGRAAALLADQVGYLDFLVNNAGVLFEKMKMPGDLIGDLDVNRFRHTMDVNVTGTAIVVKSCIGLLYASSKSCIINITSEAGCLNAAGYEYLAYSVSKYAVNMYTQKIRNYLKQEKPEADIRVYMVHPGRMDTVMGRENAQISPAEPAAGIFDILEENKKLPDMDIPFINYKGEPMPH